MAQSLDCDLQVDKVLMWKVHLPFQNQVRQSSNFSLIGSEWYLRFSHKGTSESLEYDPKLITHVYKTVYHVITLHKAIPGQVATTAASGQQLLKEKFSVKTSVLRSTGESSGIFYETNSFVDKNTKQIWHAGYTNEKIFKKLPSEYRCCEVTVVCKFYGQPLTTFQLGVVTDHPSPVVLEELPIRTEDKSIQAFPGVFQDAGIQVSSVFPRDIESLSSDLSHLLDKELLSDVQVECGDRNFRAHRSVLAARSNVFRAMFLNKTLESESGVVKIKDMNVAILQDLLRFLYTGRSEDISEGNASDLYKAGDKYAIISLKTACAYIIERHLAVENCVEYLKMADSYSDFDLKAAVISFIIQNPDELKSSEWLLLSKQLPALAVEVFQAYIS